MARKSSKELLPKERKIYGVIFCAQFGFLGDLYLTFVLSIIIILSNFGQILLFKSFKIKRKCYCFNLH